MNYQSFRQEIIASSISALLALLVVGCGSGSEDPIKGDEPNVPVPIVGNFLFKEIYYTGATGSSGQHYFHDQFVEIYNAANGTLYADGLLIGDVHGVAGEINPGQEPTPFGMDTEHVYLNSVWQVPGTGKDYPIEPGKTLLIAHDATNHQPDSPLDLTAADFETYNEREDMKDVDWPIAPNLTRIHFTGGFDWLLPVFGAAVVVFRAEDPSVLERVDIPGASELGPRIKVPNALVIDAFEALQNANSGAYKRVPTALDKGFVFASDTYTGESARRKIIGEEDGRKILADTNDSSADFEILAQPAPRSF
jgi:hypothetical protein